MGKRGSKGYLYSSGFGVQPLKKAIRRAYTWKNLEPGEPRSTYRERILKRKISRDLNGRLPI